MPAEASASKNCNSFKEQIVNSLQPTIQLLSNVKCDSTTWTKFKQFQDV